MVFSIARQRNDVVAAFGLPCAPVAVGLAVVRLRVRRPPLWQRRKLRGAMPPAVCVSRATSGRGEARLRSGWRCGSQLGVGEVGGWCSRWPGRVLSCPAGREWGASAGSPQGLGCISSKHPSRQCRAQIVDDDKGTALCACLGALIYLPRCFVCSYPVWRAKNGALTRVGGKTPPIAPTDETAHLGNSDCLESLMSV